jgi:hypothetical protein
MPYFILPRKPIYIARLKTQGQTMAHLHAGNDVSERVRQLAEQQEKERLAADDAPAMSVVQIGHFKKTIGEVSFIDLLTPQHHYSSLKPTRFEAQLNDVFLCHLAIIRSF